LSLQRATTSERLLARERKAPRTKRLTAIVMTERPVMSRLRQRLVRASSTK
jgi:hypothetical protein